MTRQKKVILSKIEALELEVLIDQKMSYYMAPAGAYDSYYIKIDKLNEELAHLRHYKTAEEMFMDERGCPWTFSTSR